MEGEEAAGLEQFLEMLRRDRNYGEQLAKRSLIDAFRIIEDPELVGAYRRRMAALLF
jgi:putative thioredoxin